MVEQNSIGIAEKIPGNPGQGICTSAVVARHNFILSRFKPFPIPDSDAVQLRFSCDLPRAPSLHKAVNLAMAQEGIVVSDGTVEISAEEEHQMLALLSLFVPVEPEIIKSDDSRKRKGIQKTYAYHCKQAFKVEAGRTAKQALSTTYPYQAPREIVGLLNARSEIFYLMHTALRKAACSAPTAAAHAAMHLASPKTRLWLVDTVDKVFQSRSFSFAEEVIEAIRHEFMEGANEDWRQAADGDLLYTLFTLFTDQDWFNMLCYFFIWPGAVAQQKTG